MKKYKVCIKIVARRMIDVVDVPAVSEEAAASAVTYIVQEHPDWFWSRLGNFDTEFENVEFISVQEEE